MQIKCDYCGSFIEDTQEKCPFCGAVNNGYHRESNEVPRTIADLKQWYVDHNLPPKEVTRFFIGEDYKEPRAFGIYEENGRFIVYKNKDNGERAIRYDGGDEAYAVNELYLKLKERISQEKARNEASKIYKKKPTSERFDTILGFLVVAVILVVFMYIGFHTPDKGYYEYDGNEYYYNGSDWYYYDDYYNDWYETDVDDTLTDNYSTYYETDDYDSSTIDGTDIRESDVYSSSWDASSDWDSDDSWDSGDSWSSDGGDWGSDW